MRIRVIAAIVFAAALFSGAPASAEGYGGGTLTIDDSTLVPGQRFRLPGTGCPAGVTVVVSFDGRQIGTTTAAEDGSFEFVGIVPPETAPGQFAVGAACGDLVQSLVITVSAPTLAGAAPRPAAPLPRTGAEIGPLVRMAVALLLIGAGFTFLARRRASVRPA